MTSALDRQNIQQRWSERVNEYKTLSDQLSRHQEDTTKTWMKLSALHESITSLSQMWHQSVIKPGIDASKSEKPPSPASDVSPVQFGNYRLIDLIGYGPHTTVYLAVNAKTHQRVAIEILLPDLSEDPHTLKKFRQDIDTIRSFHHEAIVPIYDVNDFKGQPYLISRYLPQGSLRDVINLASPGHLVLPVAAIQNLINRMAAALEAAHDKGIVHGNIKPANILCNEKRMWFLSHFGFIQLTDQVKTISFHYTEPSPYLAPEQWRGEAIGPYTDIYQLGVVVFQLLTGQHPFIADELGQLIKNHLTVPLPSAIKINPRLPASCQDVLAKAMAKSPQDRYETPGQLAAALARALTQEQIDNRFRIKHEIGKGATATVYLAHDQKMKRDVAIKLLPVSHSGDDRRRFEKEVQTIASLKNSSIVMVHDLGEHQGTPYLVMEYMSGGTLLDILHQSPGPMPWEAVHPILKRLTAALTAAHRAKIVHCDIKPGNVLLGRVP